MKFGGVPAVVSSALSLLFVPIASSAEIQFASSCVPATKPQIAALFDRWNDSLRTGDPGKVVANYAPDAVLLPTASHEPRTNPAEIRDYFVNFLKKRPHGTIEKRIVRIGCNVAQDVGTYTFRFSDGKAIRARYTYVYEWENDKWLIAHHHSSAMPEGGK